MKLSNRELKLIAGAGKRRSDRRKGAWLGLATTVLLFVASQNGAAALQEIEAYLIIAIAFSAMYLARIYFSVQHEDKLVELLQRYVNQDPEAVAQIAESAKTSNESPNNRAASST